MSVLEIVKIDSPNSEVLNQVAKPIENIEPRYRDLAKDMIDTMMAADGMGLAANQIGILERIIVVSPIDTATRRFYIPLVMINPEIIEFSDEKMDKWGEGCLSIPGKFGSVDRYSSVTVKYKNLSGKDEIQQFSDLTAVCVQHEIDHLDGVLFTSKAKTLKDRTWEKKENKDGPVGDANKN